MLCEGLKGANIQAKVLSIYTKNNGHAVCVYLYPTGKNTLWVWDADWGSQQIIAYYDNPQQVARGFLNTIGDYSILTSATYRE